MRLIQEQPAQAGVSPTHLATIIADPVAYLALHGIEAEVVEGPAAALVEAA